ncbi:MAG: DUF6702 family protein [Pyrinomonadaceae bacterium]
MKLAGYVLSLALVACALTATRVLPAASAHKFHTSFAEAEYNARERSLEVTLRTFPDDLENILSKRSGKRVSLDRKREAEPLLTAYLQETFQLKDAQGKTVKLTWVGMDAGVDSVWLYFEARLPGGFAGAQLRNQFLFDLFDDQVNLVNVKVDTKKQSLSFKPGDNFQSLAPL